MRRSRLSVWLFDLTFWSGCYTIYTYSGTSDFRMGMLSSYYTCRVDDYYGSLIKI